MHIRTCFIFATLFAIGKCYEQLLNNTPFVSPYPIQIQSVPSPPFCNLSDPTTFLADQDTAGFQRNGADIAVLYKETDQLSFLVTTWQSNQDGSGLGVYARIFQVDKATGDVIPYSDPFLVNSGTLYGKACLFKFIC